MIQQWKILSFFPFIHYSQFNWIHLPKAWLRSYYSKNPSGSPLSTELSPDTLAWYLRPYTNWPQLIYFYSPIFQPNWTALAPHTASFFWLYQPGSHHLIFLNPDLHSKSTCQILLSLARTQLTHDQLSVSVASSPHSNNYILKHQ